MKPVYLNQKYVKSIFHLLLDQYLMPDVGNKAIDSVDFFGHFASELNPELNSVGLNVQDTIKSFITTLRAHVLDDYSLESIIRIEILSVISRSWEGRVDKYSIEKMVKNIQKIITMPEYLSDDFEVSLKRTRKKHRKTRTKERMEEDDDYDVSSVVELTQGLAKYITSETYVPITLFDVKVHNIVRDILNDIPTIITAGWSNHKHGHLITFYIEPMPQDLYRVTLCNSGSGLIYHYQTPNGKFQVILQNIVRKDVAVSLSIFSVLINNVFNADEILFYLTLHELSFQTEPAGWTVRKGHNAEIGYQDIPHGLDENTRIDIDYPQLSGSCTFYGIYYLFKYYFYYKVVPGKYTKDQLFSEVNSYLLRYGKLLFYQYVDDKYIAHQKNIPDEIINYVNIIHNTKINPTLILDESDNILHFEELSTKLVDGVLLYYNTRVGQAESLGLTKNWLTAHRFVQDYVGLLSRVLPQDLHIDLEVMENLRFSKLFNFIITFFGTDEILDIELNIFCGLVIYLSDVFDYHIKSKTVDYFFDDLGQQDIDTTIEIILQIFLKSDTNIVQEKINTYLTLIILKISIHTPFQLFKISVLEKSKELDVRVKETFLINFFNHKLSNSSPRMLKKSDISILTDHLILFAYNFEFQAVEGGFEIEIHDFFETFHNVHLAVVFLLSLDSIHLGPIGEGYFGNIFRYHIRPVLFQYYYNQSLDEIKSVRADGEVSIVSSRIENITPCDNLVTLFSLLTAPQIDVQNVNDIFNNFDTLGTYSGYENSAILSIIPNQYNNQETFQLLIKNMGAGERVSSISMFLMMPNLLEVILKVMEQETFETLNQFVVLLMIYILILSDVDIPKVAYKRILYFSKFNENTFLRYCFKLVSGIIHEDPLIKFDSNIFKSRSPSKKDDTKYLILSAIHIKYVTLYPNSSIDYLSDLSKVVNMKKKIKLIAKEPYTIKKGISSLHFYDIFNTNGETLKIVDFTKTSLYSTMDYSREPYINEEMSKYFDDYTIAIMSNVAISNDEDLEDVLFIFPIYGPKKHEYVDPTELNMIYVMSYSPKEDQDQGQDLLIKLYKRMNGTYLKLFPSSELEDHFSNPYLNKLAKTFENCSLIFSDKPTRTLVIDVLKAEYQVSIIITIKTIKTDHDLNKEPSRDNGQDKFNVSIFVGDTNYQAISEPLSIYRRWSYNLPGTFIIENTKSESGISLLIIENTYNLLKKAETVIKTSIFIQKHSLSLSPVQHYKNTRCHIIDIHFTGTSLKFPTLDSIIVYFILCSIYSKTFALDSIFTLAVNTIQQLFYAKLDEALKAKLTVAQTLLIEGCNNPYFKYYRKLLVMYNDDFKRIISKVLNQEKILDYDMLAYDTVIKINVSYQKLLSVQEKYENVTFPVKNFSRLLPDISNDTVTTDIKEKIKKLTIEKIQISEIPNDYLDNLIEIYNMIISVLFNNITLTPPSVKVNILEDYSKLDQNNFEFIRSKLPIYHGCSNVNFDVQLFNQLSDLAQEIKDMARIKIMFYVSTHADTTFDQLMISHYPLFYLLLSFYKLSQVLDFVVTFPETTNSCREYVDILSQLRNPKPSNIVDMKSFEEIRFELSFGHFLKEPQVRVWKNIFNEVKLFKENQVDDTYSIFQLLMGSGKTSVIIPLLCMSVLQLQNTQFALVIMPKHLVEQMIISLGGYYSILNVKIIKLINLRRLKTLSYHKLDKEIDKLSMAFDSTFPTIIVTDSESFQVIKLNKKELPYTDYSKNVEEKPLEDMLNRSPYRINALLVDITNKIKTKSVLIIDEFDLLSNPLSNEVNFSLNQKTLEEDPIIPPKVIQNAINHILDKNITEDLDEYEARCWNLLLQKIHKLDQKIYNKDYGFPSTSSHVDQLFAVPYRAVDYPVPGTEFSDLDTKIILTIYSYKNGGLRYDDYYRIIQDCLSTVKQYNNIIDHSQIVGLLQLKYLNEVIEPIEDHLVLLSVSEKNSPIYSEVINGIMNRIVNGTKNQTKELIEKYLENIVLPNVRFSLDQINSSFTEAICNTESLCKSGFSGTVNFELPEFDNNSHEFTKIVYDHDGRADTYISILGLLDENPKIFTTKLLKNGSIADVTPILERLFRVIKEGSYDALIDVGAYLLGFKAEDVIVYAMNILDFENFVYVDYDGRKMYRKKNNADTLPYLDIKFKANTVFMYYDHKHTVGVDIKQPYKMLGLVTVSKFNRFTDISQGSYRLRKLNKGHSVDFVIDIDLGIGDRATFLKWLLVRDIEYWETECKFRATFQNVKIISRILTINGRLNQPVIETKFNEYVLYKKNISDDQMKYSLLSPYVSIGRGNTSPVGKKLFNKLVEMISEGGVTQLVIGVEIADNLNIDVQVNVQILIENVYGNDIECGKILYPKGKLTGNLFQQIVTLTPISIYFKRNALTIECKKLGMVLGKTLIISDEMQDLMRNSQVWLKNSRPGILTKSFILNLFKYYSTYYVLYDNYILLCGHGMATYFATFVNNSIVHNKYGGILSTEGVIFNTNVEPLKLIMKYLLGCSLDACEIINNSYLISKSGIEPFYKTWIHYIYCRTKITLGLRVDINELYDRTIPKLVELITQYASSTSKNLENEVINKMIESISDQLDNMKKENRLVVYEALAKCLDVRKMMNHPSAKRHHI